MQLDPCAEAAKAYVSAIEKRDALLAEASGICGQAVTWTHDIYDLAAHTMTRKLSQGVGRGGLAREIELAVLDVDAAAFNSWFHSRRAERDALKTKWVYVLDGVVCLTPFETDEDAFAKCLLHRRLGPSVAFTVCVSDSPFPLPCTWFESGPGYLAPSSFWG
jgi:hypothetical protein